MLNKDIESYSLEKRYISKTGKVIWVLLTVSLVWNSDATPKFFISQIVDVTKRKELTDELNRKNTELEAIRTSLINKVYQLEEFSYIVAYNLRGPASNIKMLAEVLKEPGSDSGIFTETEAINLIDQASSSLVESLDTLMSIAQVRLNKDIAYDECNIVSVVEQVSSQLQGVIFEKKAVITNNLAIKTISNPKAYLENILYNLISNALKYTHNDIAPRISISTKMKGKRTILSVSDNCLAIDLEKYGDRIFKLNEFFHECLIAKESDCI